MSDSFKYKLRVTTRKTSGVRVPSIPLIATTRKYNHSKSYTMFSIVVILRRVYEMKKSFKVIV
ncbi:hypothetical protein GCM10008920_07300 [Pediococcus acidilactici]|nr:hypothetical protein GCM10008920_07300 [Pediococcus acidilactici]